MSPAYSKFIFFSLVALAVALEITGDIFFKKWALENKTLMLWTGFIIYAAGSLFWALSLKYEMLSKAISLFTVLNLLIVALVGVIFFKENISLVAKTGIILGIISIALIELG